MKNLGVILGGVEPLLIEIEVLVENKLPSFVVASISAASARETAERVRSAIESCGFEFPRKRVVVNLAPADLKKDGTSLDLPIALGILAADGRIPEDRLQGVVAMGELALGGEIRPVRGALAAAEKCEEEEWTLLVSAQSAPHAAIIPGAEIVGVRTLAEAVAWLRGECKTPVRTDIPLDFDLPKYGPDMADVRGQAKARRALEIAAAGGHHLLLVGPPGCGKSMLARRLPSILPPLTPWAAVEVAKIRDAASLLISGDRPFRAPHHTVTVAGMVGDHTLRPGEICLASQGVLFLDEAPEFSREVLDILPKILQDGEIRRHIRGRERDLIYPAEVALVVATNPCPCGQGGECRCNPELASRYLGRLRPLQPHVDLRVDLSSPTQDELLAAPPGESSAKIRERVVAAREILNRLSYHARRSGLAGVAQTIAALRGSAEPRKIDYEEAVSLFNFPQEKP